MIDPLTTGTGTDFFTYTDPNSTHITYTSAYTPPQTIEDKLDEIITLLRKLVDK